MRRKRHRCFVSDFRKGAFASKYLSSGVLINVLDQAEEVSIVCSYLESLLILSNALGIGDWEIGRFACCDLGLQEIAAV